MDQLINRIRFKIDRSTNLKSSIIFCLFVSFMHIVYRKALLELTLKYVFALIIIFVKTQFEIKYIMYDVKKN